MNLEDSTTGAIGGLISGFLVSILHAIGVDRRITRLEKEKLEKEVFQIYQEGLNQRFDKIEELLWKIYNGGCDIKREGF